MLNLYFLTYGGRFCQQNIGDLAGAENGGPVGRYVGQLTADVKIADGKATFEKLEAKGGDAELHTEGIYFLVQPRMEFAPIFGKAKLKVADAFWSKSGTQSFKGLAEMALGSSRGRDGAWNLGVTGSVGHPRMQPMPQGQ